MPVIVIQFIVSVTESDVGIFTQRNVRSLLSPFFDFLIKMYWDANG